MIKVTADIFSGRPNPEWVIAGKERHGGSQSRHAGHIVTDPQTANRGPYTIFCRFMFAQKKMVVK